ncbi:hypothetical protein [Haloarchaeobius sp. DFWS5]|uniref:hypothetical protein n=1 Tax=Haloarchaeobius sp. DFWS5 TaxID=3446114 RepID=UPI003EB81D53
MPANDDSAVEKFEVRVTVPDEILESVERRLAETGQADNEERREEFVLEHLRIEFDNI